MSYSISALLVLPRNTAREPRRQQRRYSLRCLDRDQEWGIPIGILADTVLFMASVNEELLASMYSSAPCVYHPLIWRRERDLRLAHGYIQQIKLCSQVERGVAIVGEVWVLQALGVVLDDAFEEGEVFEVDGSADTDGDVNPEDVLGLSWRVCFDRRTHMVVT